MIQLLIFISLFTVGACHGLLWQKLKCPYAETNRNLSRVWCRQSSVDCCTGLILNRNSTSVDGGKMKVTQDLDSFTVALLEPPDEAGVYWCGVLSRNNTIIKLAERYFYSSPAAYIWSLFHWMLLLLLFLMSLFTFICYKRATKQIREKAEFQSEPAERRALADPQYENIAPFCELEFR